MRARDTYTLRAATNADQGAVWALISGVLAEYGITTDPSTTDADLVDLEPNYSGNQGCLFALLDGEKLIGTVAIRRESDFNCELCRMYVLPQYRRQGLGRLLLDTAEKEARLRGFTEMHLKTAAVLVEAIKLYQSVGFAKTDRVPGSKNCSLVMSKLLV